MARAPHRPLDIAGEIDEPALSLFSDNHCRFTGRRLGRVGQFGRIGHESRHYAQRRAGHRCDRYPVLCARQPVGFPETAQNLMLLFNAFYARIEKQHEILRGFGETNWLPGAEYRVPIAPVAGAPLSVVPGFVAYPPELSYPPQTSSGEPAMVVREKGKSRLVYFPGDIERTMWRSGHTDLARLLQNAIRWISYGDSPVRIEGQGVIEAFAWETERGFAVHILNYTNPNMHRGWLREFYPIGEQKVKMKLPAGRRVTRVELLRAEKSISFKTSGGVVEFTIPKVLDYEVAALYSS